MPKSTAERTALYRQNHPDKVRVYQKEYFANRYKMLAKQKEWDKASHTFLSILCEDEPEQASEPKLVEDIVYREIAGYPNYRVSSTGEVMSLKKGILSQKETLNGYLKVDLSRQGTRIMFYVSRLVAAAFLPNPDEKPFVDHIDHNRKNNRVENLRWVTNSENNQNRSMNKKGNVSGHKGVSACRGKWCARIKLNSKEIRLGTFTTIEEAIEARRLAEIKYFGEYSANAATVKV